MDKPTILIVEDERSARHGMRMLLERIIGLYLLKIALQP